MSDQLSATATAEPAVGRTPTEIRAAAAPVLQRLAATAAERERERAYAFDDVRALAEQRITLIGVPAADGGAGGSLRDVTELVREIARADSNVAQALRGSFLVANRVAGRPDLPNRDVTLARLRNGDLFAGTVNERAGGPNGSVRTTIRRAGEGHVLNGEKYYSTGGLTRRGSPAPPRTKTGPSWTSRSQWTATACCSSTISTRSASA
ncbi:acyl-CoA dehydrogenase family protein [Saccharopolyspora flava]|uniref:Acyl-CoA dehydrogenase, N-terminal domain n=1 Tax=Saccharopolyspora flava TaxID=95161 RepID=A0A1I6USY9_9PSEU|nr:acyl-CoA dehydrogenase family protein [Saccharopolyspora flava]SFT04565.1 Acyl-CoA dehydrogenase, N-terminal domain [Saccharopolyspora flava]